MDRWLMGAYISRRLLIALPVLLGITIVAFIALSLAPGDPLTARIDPVLRAQMTPEQLAQARHELGLDQPVPVRYAIWLTHLVQGDLGYSTVSQRPVATDLGLRFGPTLLLMGTALLIGIVVGVPLGVIAAVKQYSLTDYVAALFATSFIVIPGFVLGLIAIYVFAVALHLLPTGGMQTLGQPTSPGDLVAHMAMPASILGLALAAQLMRYSRASMLDILRSDFMLTARAKGLPAWLVLSRHGLRNALIPIITVIGLTLPDTVGGAVITEQVFSWPGMGQLAVHAAANRDPPLLMGVILVVATGVLLSNLAADVAYAFVDPRIRLGQGG
jgi:peptide/nickel transport system permease protein